MEINRCPWCKQNPLMTKYHDEEWGAPIYDDHKFFEFLVLESAQAGLSWLTILQRREGYRTAFDQFNPHKISIYTPAKLEKLIQNPNIIRNRLKIYSVVKNARAFLAIQEKNASFSDYIWQFVGGKPIKNNWEKSEQVPTTTPVSDRMARDLKKLGFTFLGSTICYAFMQATGMVDDHLVGCFKYEK